MTANNYTGMSVAMAAFIMQQQSGISRVHVVPFNVDVQKYSVTCRTSDIQSVFAEHQRYGSMTHEIIS